MAPKRGAKKAAAPPPPPPPPAESSDETGSDESEDEEAIAGSPVPAASTPTPTPILKKTPAPSQKGDESESSDDDDEEEDEPVRAPPKNQPPPPHKEDDSETSGDEEEEPTRAAPPSAPTKQPPQPQEKDDSDTSGDEDESDEDESDEEEAPPPPPPQMEEDSDTSGEEEDDDEEEPTRAALPTALTKQPPQPQEKEDPDTSGDEGESDEEEAPPLKPAPKKDAVALKPPAATETKKPGAAQRIWSTDDEVRILEAIAAHQEQHGTFPQPDALVQVLAGKLDNPSYGSKELHSKVRSLRTRYLTLSRKAEIPSKEHDRRILHLSKLVWTGDKITAPGAATASNGQEPKGFEEMCELYPYLAEEVKALEAGHPGMCKRVFGKMDDGKAHAMDEKIKRQRVVQIKLEMRRSDLTKEVTKALVDLVDG